MESIGMGVVQLLPAKLQLTKNAAAAEASRRKMHEEFTACITLILKGTVEMDAL